MFASTLRDRTAAVQLRECVIFTLGCFYPKLRQDTHAEILTQRVVEPLPPLRSPNFGF